MHAVGIAAFFKPSGTLPLKYKLSRLLQPKKQPFSNEVTEDGIVIEVKPLQPAFVAHIENQRVTCNTVEKSCREYFEDVKSYRFNGFNFI